MTETAWSYSLLLSKSLSHNSDWSRDTSEGQSPHSTHFLLQEVKENKVIKLENSIIFMPYDNYAIISTNPEEFDKNLYIDNLSLLGYKSSDFFDIDHHTPFITSSFIETYTPQMLSLDILDGVSFEKGCYPGQEIVARTHYLGEAKKSLLQI